MIFAEIDDPRNERALHPLLHELLSTAFPHLQSGLQGDSWFWVEEGGCKVSIDNFTSIKHQVKSNERTALLERVIQVLQSKFRIHIYSEPENEAHED